MVNIVKEVSVKIKSFISCVCILLIEGYEIKSEIIYEIRIILKFLV